MKLVEFKRKKKLVDRKPMCNVFIKCSPNLTTFEKRNTMR